MRRRLVSLMSCGLTFTLILSFSWDAEAQQFTGGLRGAVRDANGIIPGVEVTLLNEGTAVVPHDGLERGGRVLVPRRHSRDLHAAGGAAGIQDLRPQGHPDRHAAVHHPRHPDGSRTIQEEISVTASSPLIETSNASPGAALGEALENAARAGPRRGPDGGHGPDRQCRWGSAVQPAAGPDEHVAYFARRRRHPGQQLPARRRADHRLARAGGGHPDDRDDRRGQGPVHTYDAEVGRTGGGVFNTTAKSGTNDFHGTALYQTRPVWASRRTTSTRLRA